MSDEPLKFKACFLNKIFNTYRWAYIGVNETHKELPDERQVTSWKTLLTKDAFNQEIYDDDILIKINHDIDKVLVNLWIKAGKPLDLIPPGYEIARGFARGCGRYWHNDESFGWEGEDLETPANWVVIGNTFEHPHLLNTDQK